MIFRDQAFRLLRSEWDGPNGAAQLSQEIYAIFMAETPLQIDGPVQITSDSPGDPALSVQSTDPNNPTAVSIQHAADPPFTFGIGGFEQGGSPVEAVGSGGGGFGGVVVSGSGNAYRVKLSDGRTVAATQIQIDPGETIPAGTGCLVAESGGKFFIQVAVWL